tara:strand:- start:10242 stop:10544 length:303 start_codon:yes stop_codon:yes gene_type:complete
MLTLRILKSILLCVFIGLILYGIKYCYDNYNKKESYVNKFKGKLSTGMIIFLSVISSITILMIILSFVYPCSFQLSNFHGSAACDAIKGLGEPDELIFNN